MEDLSVNFLFSFFETKIPKNQEVALSNVENIYFSSIILSILKIFQHVFFSKYQEKIFALNFLIATES